MQTKAGLPGSLDPFSRSRAAVRNAVKASGVISPPAITNSR